MSRSQIRNGDAAPGRCGRAAAAIIFIGAIFLAVAHPSAAAAAGPRLGHNVVPSFESIRLVLDPAKPDYTGSVRVDLSVRETTGSFVFHARDIAIDRLKLSGKAGDVTAGHAAEGDGVRITTGRPLEPGTYTLDIDFSAEFSAQAAGLYRLQVDGAWYSFTQFEAADARGAFPCWDEPEFKIPFQVTLVVPKDHLAIGNTPAESERVEGDQKTVAFEKTPPLPTYLLAIATGPLETVAMQGMPVPGRVVTIRGSAGLAQEAARATPVLVGALEKYFGIPYPYRKLDVLAVPEFWAGAMENAAAITFRDSILLIDPRAAGVEQKRGLVLVTAHELAHMWFGDLVTMQWWDDLWLNESFASWMGDRIADQEFPDYKAELAQVQSMQAAMATDAHLSTRAMRQPVEGVENLDQLADELTYDKGQAVLMMFERWLGPQTFRKGVVDYLKAHRWGNATAADLWTSLSKAAGKDVGGPMATFLDQPGVPLVRAEVLPGGRVRLSQERFLNYGAKTPRPVTWQIPVVLKYSNGKTTRTLTLLLSSASRTVTLDGSPHVAWLHPNAGESGYYRWQVAPQVLSALADAAPKSLDARERVG
ncbi:MAG TPA: M1 family metallopeptidase, partial [Candidatus Dormibacteraeota bacterium]|nr:M1 family metallopeptidase [Candidatus Dormibacteraeota bacterium]